MTTSITFNDQYNTLTTSVTNARAMTCGCGKRLEPGEAVGLTEMIAYRNRRAGRMCVDCAAQIIARHHFNFRRLNKTYTHLLESIHGEISPAEAAALFRQEYEAQQTAQAPALAGLVAVIV